MVSIRGKYGDFTHDFKISTVISPVSVRDFTCVGPLAGSGPAMLATPPVHTLLSIIPTFYSVCIIHTVNNNKSKLYSHDIDLLWCQEPAKILYRAPEMQWLKFTQNDFLCKKPLNPPTHFLAWGR